jgi:putative ATP-dependent endonuclease of the OLD family
MRDGYGARVALLDRISITDYRSARAVALEPGNLCALVGEASSGKSTVLSAIWSLLEAAAPVPTLEDVSRGGSGRTHVEAAAGARTFFLDARPPATLNLNRDGAPPVLFLPANLRASELVAPATGRKVAKAANLLRPKARRAAHWAAGDGGLALLTGIERLLQSGASGYVLLIEEPELYLGPQAQRHLSRLLRRLAQHGNQLLYSTHAPAFLAVDRLDELALVRHNPRSGTTVWQPQPLSSEHSFRALAEFDAERAELFLARAALLVEGRTEKLAFPFVFEALGHDADRERIAVVECSGKGNIPLFAQICNECAIPYVVVHDRDAARGESPSEAEQITNDNIARVAGRRRTVMLVPDFEGIAGLNARRAKPEQAWRRFSPNGNGDPVAVPRQLERAVERIVAIARGEG